MSGGMLRQDRGRWHHVRTYVTPTTLPYAVTFRSKKVMSLCFHTTHAMKPYREMHVHLHASGTESLIPTVQEDGCTSESVWKLWRREQSVTLNLTPIPRSLNPQPCHYTDWAAQPPRSRLLAKKENTNEQVHNHGVWTLFTCGRQRTLLDLNSMTFSSRAGCFFKLKIKPSTLKSSFHTWIKLSCQKSN
jgi:hypothetical protein